MTILRLNLGRLGTALLIASLTAVASHADIAYLRNGRALEISGFRMEGAQVVLLMEGGGELALPSHEVVEIRRSFTPPGEPVRLRQEPHDRVPAGADPSGEAEPSPGATVEDDALTLEVGAIFDRQALRDLAMGVARKHGVDAKLVHAVIQVESSYDPFAVSHRGAMGLMQLMPQTAARFSVENAFDPEENLQGGVRYLKELLERYSGQTRLALAAYNAGEKAVERHSGIPPYRETVRYIDKVLHEARR